MLRRLYLGLGFSLILSLPVSAATIYQMLEKGIAGIVLQINPTTKVNLSGAFIQSDSDGRLNISQKQRSGRMNVSQARQVAIRLAREQAMNQLARGLGELRLDGENRVKDYLRRDAYFAQRIAQALDHAEYLHTRMENHKVHVGLVLPLVGRGSLLEYIPFLYGKQAMPEFEPLENEGAHTSLLLDVRHLSGFSPAIHLRLFTPDGQMIYGPEFVSPNYAVEIGINGFATSPESAKKQARAGKNPWYALAFAMNKTSELVISANDARLLWGNAETRHELKKCRVILITKPKMKL